MYVRYAICPVWRDDRDATDVTYRPLVDKHLLQGTPGRSASVLPPDVLATGAWCLVKVEADNFSSMEADLEITLLPNLGPDERLAVPVDRLAVQQALGRKGIARTERATDSLRETLGVIARSVDPGFNRDEWF